MDCILDMHATDALLRSISVVAIADTYRPDEIYKDLVNGRIMPDRSKIDQSVQASGGCEVSYSNGMRIAVNPQRAIIGNEYDEPLKECLNDEVHALAVKFIKMHNDVVYRAVGLNCTIALPHNDPLRWMTQKFLKAKAPPANVSMTPQFAIKTGKAALLLAFASVEESRNGDLKRFVGVDCNHHHSGPFKTDADLLRTVTDWRGTRDTVLSRLGEVLDLE